MKRKRWILWGLCLHIVISGVGYGILRVYQRGYNTMHRTPLAMASVMMQGDNAEIQVLHVQYTLPLAWLSEDSPVYYAAYVLTDAEMQFWMYLCSSLKLDDWWMA